jgi:hypothetical protein
MIRNHKISLTIFLSFFLANFYLLLPLNTYAASLTEVSDSLQSSRLSFAGRVKSPTAPGNNHVWIYTEGIPGFYSISTAGINIGDTLMIGSGAYTVASIVGPDEFTTNIPLGTGDADDTDPIYFRSKPLHVITFNTASAIPNGFFRVLIPAATITNNNDGIPDTNGFDFNLVVDTAFKDAPGYTFTTKLAIPSNSTNCPQGWHCFEYRYSGTGNAGTPITLTIGNGNGTNTPIAPSPKSIHIEAKADPYSFKVQNFASGDNPIFDVPVDETTGKIGVNESVHVSAVVLGPSATPPPGLGTIVTPAPFIPPTVPSVVPTPVRDRATPLNLFYNFLLILLIFGLPLHLLMAAVGTKTPFKKVFAFLFILAFPFLRRKKYRTVPFCFIDIFIPNKLDKPWQSTVSDINGDYNLRSKIPVDILVSLRCAHRTWKDVIIKSALLPISCLYPNKKSPLTTRDELIQNIFDARLAPLVMACLTSSIAYFIVPSPFILIYLSLSLQYAFSEYLYPRLTNPKENKARQEQTPQKPQPATK